MAFKPLIPDTRTSMGVDLGYAIRHNSKANNSLELSIGPRLVRAAKWKAGTLIRLDADKAAGKARLTVMAGATKHTRELRVTDTDRSHMSYSCTGDIADVFGHEVKPMTPLTGAEVTSEGIIFNLPKLSVDK